MSLFAAIAMQAAALAASADAVDLVVRGPSAPNRAEVVDALGVRGVRVDDDAHVRALVDCEDTCRVRISGVGGTARAEVSVLGTGDEPLARTVALAVATAIEGVARPDGAPTVAIGLETSTIPRVSLGADFHLPFGRFDWSAGPLLAVSMAHFRGHHTQEDYIGGWMGSLIAANTSLAARIGGSWQVQPAVSMRVGYATPVLAAMQGGIIAAGSRLGAEFTPSVAVLSPSGVGVRASVVLPTYFAEGLNEGWQIEPTAEIALILRLP